MQDETIIDLSQYRLNRSADDLEAARIMIEAGKHNAAANRAYYSIFHAMRSVLVLDKKDYSKHSAVISFFSKDYILTGHFDRDFSKTIRLAEALRSSSDYTDYQDTTPEEAYEIIQRATKFHDATKTYLRKRFDELQSAE